MEVRSVYAVAKLGPALTTGGWFCGAGNTVIVTSELPVNCVSLAVRRKSYAPAVVNVTFVVGFVGALKVTAAGPLTSVQLLVTVAPVGNPSSVTVPFRVRELLGSESVWLGPAETTGA